ncbi:MAG TPA: hypothetical protein PLV58_04260, partial [Campylobacterales bacterium]|nr:hypothetical protein [Campylobacterales bacterium]
YEMANDIAHSLDSATLYNTRISLEDMGVIKKVQKGQYEIVDIFLRALLSQHDDAMVALDGKLQIEIL